MNIRREYLKINRHTMERVERVDANSRERNHEVEDHLKEVLNIELTFFSYAINFSIVYLVS